MCSRVVSARPDRTRARIHAAGITVRHLIHHTSGLRDYNTLLSIAGCRGDEAFDNLSVLRITARQQALNFKPGDKYLYSNTGYTLLATVVERAVGKPFAVYAAAQMFEPLGMTVTHYHVDESRLVKNRAMAYARTAWRARAREAEQRARRRRWAVHERQRSAQVG
jgi:CubicO group peptidase (beta-lactamase class C family)